MPITTHVHIRDQCDEDDPVTVVVEVGIKMLLLIQKEAVSVKEASACTRLL
jgi:hypothetical protein